MVKIKNKKLHYTLDISILNKGRRVFHIKEFGIEVNINPIDTPENVVLTKDLTSCTTKAAWYLAGPTSEPITLHEGEIHSFCQDTFYNEGLLQVNKNSIAYAIDTLNKVYQCKIERRK